jgi:Fe2+ transport system protein B
MKSVNPCVVVIGKESAGKSQLVSSLTRQLAYAANFRGSTIDCETYQSEDFTFVDTPGILRQTDTATTRAALNRLQQSDIVLIVVKATYIDEDLADLLPLAEGKHGIIVATFWDKVQTSIDKAQTLDRLSQDCKLPLIPVDARRLTHDERSRIQDALKHAHPIYPKPILMRANWRFDPVPTLLERPHLGSWFAIFLLLTPIIVAVWVANNFAALIDPSVQTIVVPLVKMFSGLPSPLKEILVGRYGIVTMGPLLFVWAIPTVVLYALIVGSYKASGLLDRITAAMHSLIRPFGLSGRDLVRVIMGFGCNVPAVINTRACSACSRKTCISAIAFGSACSYQLGATLSVFAAANLSVLVVPYLLYLTITTLIYIWLTAPPETRSPHNLLLIQGQTFLEVPRWSSIWRESRGILDHFFRRAMPIFILISILASVLDWLSAIELLAGILNPLMALFHLPTDTALPVLLASIRKDGILLFAQSNLTAVLTPGQILTGVYLASTLLPCLVTVLTIAREQSTHFALKLMGRQMLAASSFTLVLAWICALFGW